jgi:hypothetical protein
MSIIQVSARLLTFPNLCCCCCENIGVKKYRAKSSRTTGKKVKRTQTNVWEFPICESCSIWVKVQNTAIYSLTFAIIFAVLGALGKNIVMGAIALILFGVWRIVAAKANMLKINAGCYAPPVKYLGWNGSVHSFNIMNGDYLARFAQLNAGKILG